MVVIAFFLIGVGPMSFSQEQVSRERVSKCGTWLGGRDDRLFQCTIFSRHESHRALGPWDTAIDVSRTLRNRESQFTQPASQATKSELFAAEALLCDSVGTRRA